jgi:hypothetical protein
VDRVAQAGDGPERVVEGQPLLADVVADLLPHVRQLRLASISSL